jgi:hypothetical protein
MKWTHSSHRRASEEKPSRLCTMKPGFPKLPGEERWVYSWLWPLSCKGPVAERCTTGQGAALAWCRMAPARRLRPEARTDRCWRQLWRTWPSDLIRNEVTADSSPRPTTPHLEGNDQALKPSRQSPSLHRSNLCNHKTDSQSIQKVGGSSTSVGPLSFSVSWTPGA